MKDDPLSPNGQETFFGFDYGLKKIGVAVGHLITGTTSPLETLYAINQKTDWVSISRLMDTWKPGECVVGLSYQQDGAENVITKPMLRFGRQLEGRYGVSIHMIDEALSTMEARRLLSENANVKPEKINVIHDQVAAQIILQTWFSIQPANSFKTR